MADPTLEAALAVFEDSIHELRTAIEGATTETLNRRPAGDDTNSIAVLATHAIQSTRMWLGCALDVPVPDRDRPSEFRAMAEDPADLLRSVDEVAADCRSLLRTDVSFDASVPRVEPPTTPGDISTDTTTAGWALLHAVEHLGEHAGQAALTRQVLEG